MQLMMMLMLQWLQSCCINYRQPKWYILDLTTARVNRPKYLLICNPYLDLSKLICIFRSLIIQVQKVGLPKNTKTKKKQTVNHAYASRIDLHRVNGLVPAFDGQPTWKPTRKISYKPIQLAGDSVTLMPAFSGQKEELLNR